MSGPSDPQHTSPKQLPLTGKHTVQVHRVQALLCGAAFSGGRLGSTPGKAAPAAAATEAAATCIVRAARFPGPRPARQLCSNALLQGQVVCQQAASFTHTAVEWDESEQHEVMVTNMR